MRELATNLPFQRDKNVGNFVCEVCKHKYPKLVIIDGVKHFMLEVYKGDKPSISFQSVENYQLEGYLTRYERVLENEQPFSIGRIEGNNMILLDQCISRNHCEIVLNKRGEIVMKDKLSKYGTLVYSSEM